MSESASDESEELELELEDDGVAAVVAEFWRAASRDGSAASCSGSSSSSSSSSSLPDCSGVGERLRKRAGRRAVSGDDPAEFTILGDLDLVCSFSSDSDSVEAVGSEGRCSFAGASAGGSFAGDSSAVVSFPIASNPHKAERSEERRVGKECPV